MDRTMLLNTKMQMVTETTPTQNYAQTGRQPRSRSPFTTRSSTALQREMRPQNNMQRQNSSSSCCRTAPACQFESSLLRTHQLVLELRNLYSKAKPLLDNYSVQRPPFEYRFTFSFRGPNRPKLGRVPHWCRRSWLTSIVGTDAPPSNRPVM